MTHLSEVALAFARECMGWKDAEMPRHAGRRAIEVHVYAGDGKYITKRFAFADLDAVIKAVSAWSNANHVGVKLFISAAGYECLVVNPKNFAIIAESGMDDNACRVLLSVCLESQRKLKEVECT